jgi:hypothetical protein
VKIIKGRQTDKRGDDCSTSCDPLDFAPVFGSKPALSTLGSNMMLEVLPELIPIHFCSKSTEFFFRIWNRTVSNSIHRLRIQNEDSQAPKSQFRIPESGDPF